MKKLVAKFKTSSGKVQTWSLENPTTTKTPTEIKGLLGRLGDLKLFKKDDAFLFNTIDSAAYVETTEQEIFKG